MGAEAARLDEETLAVLRALGEQLPNAIAVRAQIARLSATLTLPKGIDVSKTPTCPPSVLNPSAV